MKLLLLISLSIISLNNKIKTQPPGTIYLDSNIYIDTEYISVQSWKEYVMIKEYNNEIAFYPDTTYTINGLNYYNSGYYNSKPILKISFEAVQDYIKWRMGYINNSLKNFSMKNKCKPNFYVENYKKNIKVIYRLAKKEEYIKALKKGLLLKIDLNESFSEEEWTNASSFRCVAFLDD